MAGIQNFYAKIDVPFKVHIFKKLIINQQHFVSIACAEFYLNRAKIVENTDNSS
jgi:hypothetical protein